MIDSVYEMQNVFEVFSQRKLYALYDLQRHHPVKDRKDEELQPSDIMLIMSGLYGSDTGKEYLLRESLHIFS